jgi:trk system potassium uptake protein TrkA
MKAIIMGCGRIGEQVCRLLADEGHDVTVIDYDPEALERLGPDFKGRRIKGIGFDRDILIQAGIEDCDAFAATSSSDNANIVAGRIARHIFQVPRVVARLFDPRRTEIYRRLGLLTISSTSLGAERIRDLLVHAELEPTLSFGSGEVSLIELETPAFLIGRMVRDIQVSGEVSVVAITRRGKAFIPHTGTEFKSEDMISFSVLSAAMDRFKVLLGVSEGG